MHFLTNCMAIKDSTIVTHLTNSIDEKLRSSSSHNLLVFSWYWQTYNDGWNFRWSNVRRTLLGSFSHASLYYPCSGANYGMDTCSHQAAISKWRVGIIRDVTECHIGNQRNHRWCHRWPFSIGKHRVLGNPYVSSIIMGIFYISGQHWSDFIHVQFGLGIWTKRTSKSMEIISSSSHFHDYRTICNWSSFCSVFVRY